jgi:hypothetical protein
MGNSDSSTPVSRPGTNPSADTAGKKPAGSAGAHKNEAATSTAGRVVHDERGNAIWDWVKDTARIAIDSTSRLLKRLEVPELTLEDTGTREPRPDSARDPGGGYDPYGSSKSTQDRVGGARGVGTPLAPDGRGSGGVRGSSAPDLGGGYDPYGKNTTRKPTRKV